MGLQTIQVCGVDLDVYYDCTITRDPYGVGDSPTEYEVEIQAIEVTGDTQDIQDILADRFIDYIVDQIIEAERN
jgi:hypothetical protein